MNVFCLRALDSRQSVPRAVKLRPSRLLTLVPSLHIGHLDRNVGDKGSVPVMIDASNSERQVLCGSRRANRERMTLKICCIKLSLAARIIAMVGLKMLELLTPAELKLLKIDEEFRDRVCCSQPLEGEWELPILILIAAVLVLTQLSTELAEPENGGGTVSILLGLDVDDFRDSNSNSTLNSGGPDIQGLEVVIAFLIFAFIYATASAILIWGSIVEVSCFAFPWLFCEAVSFATQIVTIVIHIMNTDKNRNRWIILLSCFNLILSVYFWVVVFCAARSWARQKKEERENASTSTLSSGNETVNDEPFETPPIPPKCVQV